MIEGYTTHNPPSNNAPGNEEGHDVVPPRVPARPAVRLGQALLRQVQRGGGTEHCRAEALDHLRDLLLDLFRWRVLLVRFVPPRLVSWLPVEVFEQRTRHDHHRRERQEDQRQPGQAEIAQRLDLANHFP